MDEDLAWLTKKAEEPKCNEGHFTPLPPQHTHTHTLSKCNWTLKYKKVTLLPISIPTPPFQGYPPSLAKVLVPPLQVTQFLGEGGSMFRLKYFLVEGAFNDWHNQTEEQTNEQRLHGYYSYQLLI